MKKKLPNIYISPARHQKEQITYFNKHVCSIITEELEDGTPLSHIHLSNGQVIDCRIDHHSLVGLIEYYKQLD
ncbi:hypothetical protein [Candidatus Arsenophonus triatominarum]|uniref:hypothetical protein n=1 Tax=Candidatus Arsenophonus triatominarum TaxID=57911 RepID=UPI0007C57391|nr:hypothetical protein [Candidatus Arsenophonus triatominarum]